MSFFTDDTEPPGDRDPADDAETATQTATAFLEHDRLRVVVDLGAPGVGGRAATLALVEPRGDFASTTTMIAPAALVEVFTANEQRARTSQNYVRSAVGERLRVTDSRLERPEGAAPRLVVRQRDPQTGLAVETLLQVTPDAGAVRMQHRVEATSGPVVVTAVSSAVVGLGRSESDLDHLGLVWGESEWLAEGRWHEQPLREVVPRLSLAVHAQDGRGRFSLTSHGSWSTGEFVPGGIVTDQVTGCALAWQIESSGGWHWEIGQTLTGGFLSLLGPTDTEHHFSVRLGPGDEFETVAVTLAMSAAGRDGAVAELTRHRRAARLSGPSAEAWPVVYNDFMNTLMGDPSTEALTPLVDAAADVGAEVFCIDAGWFADPRVSDWWNGVGEWVEAPGRFAGGLVEVTDHIRRRGMVPGIWLEPEVVGITSPAAAALPDGAFLHRFGERVQEHERWHLDLRHPAARAHVDGAVDRVVALFGVGYLKLDYNIDPGPGTEGDGAGGSGDSVGAGLLGHQRAYRDWLVDVQRRHPGLLIENCASGGMRADQALLPVVHAQSTSDQQDARLAPPIAASAPMSILPEQCLNWAYPASGESLDAVASGLVTGLAGRLLLSGFLHRLSSEQRALVAEAVAVAKLWRGCIAASTPRWPLGLPGWDDDVVAVAFETVDESLIAVWNRGGSAVTVNLPVPVRDGPGPVSASVVFPGRDLDATAGLAPDRRAVTITLPPGPSGRLLRVG